MLSQRSRAAVFIILVFSISGVGAAMEIRQNIPEPLPVLLEGNRSRPVPPVSGSEDYRVTAGDRLSVEVWGRTELSGPHVVGPDGRITLPLIGDIRVAGRSRADVADTIGQRYELYYTHVGVMLRIDEYAPRIAQVIGSVERPGPVKLEPGSTLLDAIGQVGGLTLDSRVPGFETLHGLVFRGSDQVIRVNLGALFAHGDLARNIPLQPNDLVYIPGLDELLVYVLGEVSRSGAYPLKPGMDVMDALGEAGGRTPDAGDKVFLVRDDVQTTLSFKDSLSGAASTPELRNRDIVFVSRRGLSKVGDVIRNLNPFAFLLPFSSRSGN